MWFKVDDALHTHPKWVAASPAAKALWTTAGSWCAKQLTDGHVPRHILPILGGRPRAAQELVELGLWEQNGNGWRFVSQADGSGRTLYRFIVGDRQKIPDWMRQAVIERDGLLCGLCGHPVDLGDVHLDHVRPVSRGGRNSLANLQVAHSRCNTRKGSRT